MLPRYHLSPALDFCRWLRSRIYLYWLCGLYFLYSSEKCLVKLWMQYTIVMLLEEMASIFITPYLLIFEVPKVMVWTSSMNVFLYSFVTAVISYKLTACWWHSALHLGLHNLCRWCGRCMQVSCWSFFWIYVLTIYVCWASATLNIIALLCFNSLSLFDFRRHGNINYGSPFDAPKNLRSSQGKMEKSFLR